MTPRGDYRVSVTKDYLVFSSAHFITFAGHRCEGLHGHNYRVRVTIEGALNEEAWFVFDFVELKGIMKRLCDEIDHLVLLPLGCDVQPVAGVHAAGSSARWRAAGRARRAARAAARSSHTSGVVLATIRVDGDSIEVLRGDQPRKKATRAPDTAEETGPSGRP